MNAGASRSRATSAKRRVEEGLEALREGLAPYVDKHMRARHGAQWRQYASRGAYDGEAVGPLDVQALLKTMLGNWNDVFRHDARLRKARSFISLALEARNAAAHFAGDMEERAALRHLDAMRELLAAVGASDRESALAALYDEQREADDRPRATRHDAASDEPPLQRLPPRRNFRHSHANVSAPGGKYAPTAGTTLSNAPSRRGGTIRVLGEEMEYVYPMDAVHMILRRCQERSEFPSGFLFALAQPEKNSQVCGQEHRRIIQKHTVFAKLPQAVRRRLAMGDVHRQTRTENHPGGCGRGGGLDART